MKNKQVKLLLGIVVGLISFLAILVFVLISNSFSYQKIEIEDGALKKIVKPFVKEYKTETEKILFPFSKSTRLVVRDERLLSKLEFSQFNHNLIKKGLVYQELPLVQAKKGDYNDLFFEVKPDLSDNDQAYRIILDKRGARVLLTSPKALSYSLDTIYKLLEKKALVLGVITDYPSVKERGLTVNLSSQFYQKNQITDLLDKMAENRFNALILNFSDNNGFRIESQYDPLLVSRDGYLTKGDILDIIAYAKKLNIEIIPMLNSPGNLKHILEIRSSYKAQGLNESSSNLALDLTNRQAIEYIKGLYAEYLDLFKDSKHFHIGGFAYMVFDDYPFLDKYLPVLDEEAKKQLGSEYGWKDLYVSYLNEIGTLVLNKGLTPRVFNDALYFSDKGQAQKVQLNSGIEIDYHLKPDWSKGVVESDVLHKQGHNLFYNSNHDLFSVKLGEDNSQKAKFIYQDWYLELFHNHEFQGSTDNILGASLTLNTLNSTNLNLESLNDLLKAFGAKTWNFNTNNIVSYEEYLK